MYRVATPEDATRTRFPSRFFAHCCGAAKQLDFGVQCVLQSHLCSAAIRPHGSWFARRLRVSNPQNPLGFNIDLDEREKSMNSVTEQFAGINKAGYDNAVRFATFSLEKAEHLAKFNFQAAKAALEQGVQSARGRGEITGAKEFAAVNTKLSEAGVQQALGYTRGLYEIASQGQAEFTTLADDAWPGYTNRVSAWVETAAKNAPAGSEVAVKALKSTVAATNAAYEQFSKVTQQIVSLTDATVRAAITNAVKATPATKVSKTS